MFYEYDWIQNNICLHDSRDMVLKPFRGGHCFLITHHVKNPRVIEKSANVLLQGGFSYFNIFGEQADLWKQSLTRDAETSRRLLIEDSKVARIEMVYNLAMLSALNPRVINLVVSDDAYFTEYLREDLQSIQNGDAPFTPLEWQRFRDGYEFKHHGRDAVVSVGNGVILGYLGEEKAYKSVFKAFYDKIFDGQNFYELWKERSTKSNT